MNLKRTDLHVRLSRGLSRARNEESGFTLTELLVTILMLTTVLFALYSLFDMSLRVFSVSNDRTEVNQGARVAMERMEREIRMAFPQTNPSDTTKRVLLCASGSTYCSLTGDSYRIAFGNDLNGENSTDPPDRNICLNAGCSVGLKYDPGEMISYCASADTNGDGAGEVGVYRGVGSGGCTTSSPQLVSLGSDGSLRFRYLDKNGCDLIRAPNPKLKPICTSNPSTLPASLTNAIEPNVRAIRIELNVRVDRGPGNGSLQKLTTDITLRNRAR